MLPPAVPPRCAPRRGSVSVHAVLTAPAHARARARLHTQALLTVYETGTHHPSEMLECAPSTPGLIREAAVCIERCQT